MLNAVIGGVLIGLSVSLMLLFNGRVTGISGIIGGVINFKNLSKKDIFWRIAFLLGLFVGGVAAFNKMPELFSAQNIPLNLSSTLILILAGFLVGFGTLLGNGCTSGHGVCGISRFSMRSFVATLTFMIFGILTVLIVKLF